jgi:MSHA biogenesis protein MshK
MNRIGRLGAKRASPLALALAACSALAQPLADPMRPPQQASAPAPGGDKASSEAPAVPQLHTILISGTRKLAVIDGATVPLGGRVGDAKVVRIAEAEVTLRRGEELQVLKLHAGVEKTRVGDRAAAKKRAARNPAQGSKGAR